MADPTVFLPCIRERAPLQEGAFLNIEEDIQGRDVVTFKCWECGEVHKSLVWG